MMVRRLIIAFSVFSFLILSSCVGEVDGAIGGSSGGSTPSTVSVIYYIGGYDGAWANKATVYVSKDNGVNWSEVGTNSLNIAVTQPNCFYHNGKLLVVGGNNGAAATDDVQSSDDGGLTWTTHVATLPNVIQGSTFAKLGNTLYLLGGYDTANTNIIYSSTDGINWIAPGPTLASGAGAVHSSVVFNNKIWLVGGQPAGVGTKTVSFDGSTATTSPGGGLSDIPVTGSWYSGYVIGSTLFFANQNVIISTSDGTSWVNETAANSKSLPFASIFGHQILTYNNEAYLMGGFTGAQRDEVYKSTNGLDWTLIGHLPEVRASGCAIAVELPQSIADAL